MGCGGVQRAGREGKGADHEEEHEVGLRLSRDHAELRHAEQLSQECHPRHQLPTPAKLLANVRNRGEFHCLLQRLRVY